jgi:hypothetical protein
MFLPSRIQSQMLEAKSQQRPSAYHHLKSHFFPSLTNRE